MKYLMFFLFLVFSLNVYGKSYLLNHEGLELGTNKEDVLKIIKAHTIKEYEKALNKTFPDFKTKYIDITDSTYYEIVGIEFSRYLKFEKNRLININLSSEGIIFLNKDEMKKQTQKLINLFIKKGKTLSNKEVIFKKEKLENIGQVFGYVGVEPTEEDCFFDGSKSIKTSHLYQLENTDFILEYQSSPCFPNGNRFIITYDIYYKLNSIYVLIEEERKIKKSTL